MFRLDSDNAYRAEAFDKLAWLDHAFGTRLTAIVPSSIPLATLRQIHSAKVLLADRPGVIGEGDALITNQPGIVLGIRTADCLPVLIVDTKNRALAAVHAGWRGVVQRIVPNTVEALASHFASRSEDLAIAIGPGIGPCCFEVGPEVAEQFAPYFPERQDLSTRTKVDLAETIVRQLRHVGISCRQIVTSRLCTCCRPELFHSYRRDRTSAGRMMSTVGIRSGEPKAGT